MYNSYIEKESIVHVPDHIYRLYLQRL